ncbi:MAG: class I mannose-6-phosphate isomerase [Bacteroidales bacterium]|nr:class I mannose-6-phosphate isomerase [Bacteroidales bacterium]
MEGLYPLKFKPLLLEKIWGGRRIGEILDFRPDPVAGIGEAWLVSGVEGKESEVINGYLKGNNLNELVEVFMDDLVGEQVYEHYGNQFPVLVKLIHSNDWLSIQVHPNDDLAYRRHGLPGKSELWYIMEAEEGAELISGFNRRIGKADYLSHLEEKSLTGILNFEKVKGDDVFFIPAGRIHALGPGIVLSEIQQTSDITYRIYDWDRIDAAGFTRELHTGAALEAIDFSFPDSYKTQYEPRINETVTLNENRHFTTRLLWCDASLRKDYSGLDSFVILQAVQGGCRIVASREVVVLKCGETVLLPATQEVIEVHPAGPARLLEVYCLPGATRRGK